MKLAQLKINARDVVPELQTSGWTRVELGQLIMKEGATLLLGFLNFDADTVSNTQYLVTLKLRQMSTNPPMMGRLISKDPKNHPSVKIFVDKHSNFRWRQLVYIQHGSL